MTGTCWTTPMVRSSPQIRLFTGFECLLVASLGTPLVKPCGAPSYATFYLVRISLQPSRWISGRSGTQRTTTVWTYQHSAYSDEAWLDVHPDELVAKGAIGPILLGEQLKYIMLLLLVPGVQSRQAYQVCQNIDKVRKWMA